MEKETERKSQKQWIRQNCLRCLCWRVQPVVCCLSYLIDVLMCVSHWEKGNMDLIEHSTLNQQCKVGKHVLVLVLSPTVVQL